ncbi:MAG: molybdenum cofactor guanylyltransferase [Gammaproteobacteria bacterium]|nr:molybdenum cofactor guanylyltransferase [Rhodocyclaceae bacterium]MBU3908650.1 molybdenum cofactor guanylyltransferase [Gammaproteobacteria bacterium]MBU3988104.1 molybdenum cofactor guanylyltransferase [Gammaproteobacteria bacterium]MBU4004678.1 molybdenum cofactor guanylyltransferase [Gammaproteobacteria bacterium]MBU4021281.1 molybdenum cofactor guanylyltransferase [Gammaproteobacteria bacterium]
MGGADKGLLTFQGRPLVAHVLARLTPQVAGLLISANRNLDEYRAFGPAVLPDATDERLGPLAGLQAGLAACPTPWLVTCPCDCPDLPTDLVARLLSAAEEQGSGTLLAVAATTDGLQPAFQLCHRELLPRLDAYLAAGGRKLTTWCKEQDAIEVMFPDPKAFANLNSPADLAAPAG